MANVMSPTTTTTSIPHFHYSNSTAALCNAVLRRQSVTFCMIQQEFRKSLMYFNQPRARDHKSVLKPICVASSGLETSVGNASGGTIRLKNVEVAIESQDTDNINLRFDLPGEETQKVFDVILSKLARSAPSTPGFRVQKGGKSSKIPKDLLVNILGKDMVMKFVIREIVTSAVANYVEKENLAVKEKKMKTTQTEDELRQSFSPGTAFGFNAELELVNGENVTGTSDESSGKINSVDGGDQEDATRGSSLRASLEGKREEVTRKNRGREEGRKTTKLGTTSTRRAPMNPPATTPIRRVPSS